MTPRTKVVLPVHLFGQTADMTALAAIARLTESPSSRTPPRPSAPPSQALRREVSGWHVLVLRDEERHDGRRWHGHDHNDDLAASLRIFRNQGMRERYRYDAFGLNLRLTDLQAAVGLPQLERLDEINERRARHAAGLTEGLTDIRGLTCPVSATATGTCSTNSRCASTIGRARPHALQARLADDGIGAVVYYPRLVCDGLADSVLLAVAVTGQVLSLPVHQHLSDGDLERIVCSVRKRTRMSGCRVALVGAGAMAANHARVIAGSHRASVAVVVDRDGRPGRTAGPGNRRYTPPLSLVPGVRVRRRRGGSHGNRRARSGLARG